MKSLLRCANLQFSLVAFASCSCVPAFQSVSFAQVDVGYTLHFSHLRSTAEVRRAVVLAQEAGATVVSVVPAAHAWENRVAEEMVRAAFRETQARDMKVVLSRMDASVPRGENWLFAHALRERGRMPDGSRTSDLFRATVGNDLFVAWQRDETLYYAKTFGREPNLLGVAVGGFVEPFVSERGSLLEWSARTRTYEVAQYTSGGRREWHRWLSARFGKIERINSEYATHFRGLDTVPLPRSECDRRFGMPRRAYSDFLQSVNDWFLKQYRCNRALWHRYSDKPFILQFSVYDAEKLANGRSCFAALDLPGWIREADALGLSIYTHNGYRDWGHSSAFAMIHLLAYAREQGKDVFVMECGCEMPQPVVLPHELQFATKIGLALKPRCYLYEYLKYADTAKALEPGHMIDHRFHKHEPGFGAVANALRCAARSVGSSSPPVFYYVSVPDAARESEEAGRLNNAIYAVAGWLPCRIVSVDDAPGIPDDAFVLLPPLGAVPVATSQRLLDIARKRRWTVACSRATAAALRRDNAECAVTEYQRDLMRATDALEREQALADFISSKKRGSSLPVAARPGISFVLTTTSHSPAETTLYVFDDGAPLRPLDLILANLPVKRCRLIVHRRDGKPVSVNLWTTNAGAPARRIQAESGKAIRLDDLSSVSSGMERMAKHDEVPILPRAWPAGIIPMFRETGGVMNRRRSQLRAPGLVTLMMAAVACACPPPSMAQGAAAAVNGETITRPALMDRLLSEFGKSLLEDMIDELIVLQEARRLRIEITEAEVDKRVEQHKASLPLNQLPPEVRYDQWLMERKLTRYAFRERMRTIVRLEKIVTPTLKVGDSDVALFIMKNPDLFNEPAKVHLRGIKKMSRLNAEQVRKAALTPGASFEQLAKTYTEDQGTRELSGDLGWRPMEVMERLMNMKAERGKISEVVASVDGYWVYQVVETQAAKEKKLPEKMAQARAMVSEQQLGSAIIRYFDDLKAKAKIERSLPEK